ncbi:MULTISPECIES: extensin family protein [unclassified Ruegeria]|uniref:extensin-like domain-containing protein n=1 Tax=unclassified Ruegeria TaxID=2625375 RepID=UPI001491484C|nr:MULTISPECIES: extensin family protein [unclassified Ruegeria]NOD48542.1 extensin [Ruegeria sp. HKCCD5849]NOD52156.1 extensin [Ruegeria sp. HKCCD5851]NOD66814.1 extensin [Ruegeria sp. HKCCD7303]
MTQTSGRRRFLYSTASFFFRLAVVVILLGGGGWWLLTHPNTPVPSYWNPLRDLKISAPVTPVTKWQLNRALANEAQCRAALAEAGVQFPAMQDLVVDQNCGISGRGLLSQLVTARMEPVETSCPTTLRLAMWENHVVQPAAQDLLGTEITRLRHIGSYNCRRMRTAQGENSGWSSHARADSIDVIGLDTADGRTLTLLADWQRNEPEAAFLRQIWRGACEWFRVVLGPDFNRLHADHFHLQGPGWGYCR